VAGKQARIAALEAQASAPDFWSDSEEAQRTMREIAGLREAIEPWVDLDARIREQADLLDLAIEEDDEAIAAEVEAEAERLAAELDRRRHEIALSGEYDRSKAILAIHAGAGGTESQDWAEMLLRMYLRWAESQGWHTEILDRSPGEEAGIKSATIEIDGPVAYGYLRSERGVHRLVRLSPFDANRRRHTSFALVEVMPEVEDAVEVEIDPDDLRIDVFRSSGAGGQNVQKNSTAIRITHLPTGLVVTCQNERSQLQNKETALKILRSRLMEIELEKKEAEQARLKGAHVDAGWGNQIRSYVLHPYTMVKDHRTSAETSNAQAVLEGELDPFIQAYLAHNLGDAA
jgi:peptide chain release factor 2